MKTRFVLISTLFAMLCSSSAIVFPNRLNQEVPEAIAKFVSELGLLGGRAAIPNEYVEGFIDASIAPAVGTMRVESIRDRFDLEKTSYYELPNFESFYNMSNSQKMEVADLHDVFDFSSVSPIFLDYFSDSPEILDNHCGPAAASAIVSYFNSMSNNSLLPVNSSHYYQVSRSTLKSSTDSFGLISPAIKSVNRYSDFVNSVLMRVFYESFDTNDYVTKLYDEPSVVKQLENLIKNGTLSRARDSIITAGLMSASAIDKNISDLRAAETLMTSLLTSGLVILLGGSPLIPPRLHPLAYLSAIVALIAFVFVLSQYNSQIHDSALALAPQIIDYFTGGSETPVLIGGTHNEYFSRGIVDFFNNILEAQTSFSVSANNFSTDADGGWNNAVKFLNRGIPLAVYTNNDTINKGYGYIDYRQFENYYFNGIPMEINLSSGIYKKHIMPVFGYVERVWKGNQESLKGVSFKERYFIAGSSWGSKVYLPFDWTVSAFNPPLIANRPYTEYASVNGYVNHEDMFHRFDPSKKFLEANPFSDIRAYSINKDFSFPAGSNTFGSNLPIFRNLDDLVSVISSSIAVGERATEIEKSLYSGTIASDFASLSSSNKALALEIAEKEYYREHKTLPSSYLPDTFVDLSLISVNRIQTINNLDFDGLLRNPYDYIDSTKSIYENMDSFLQAGFITDVMLDRSLVEASSWSIEDIASIAEMLSSEGSCWLLEDFLRSKGIFLTSSNQTTALSDRIVIKR